MRPWAGPWPAHWAVRRSRSCGSWLAALLRDSRHLDDVEYLTEAEGRAAAETNAGQVRRAWDYWSSQDGP